MHDIDRTQAELGWELGEFESGEYEYSGESEMYGEMSGEGPLGEAMEMEMAAELLEITSEEELDQFLGSLFKKVASTVGKVVRSPVGQALGGILKSVAKKALPVVGGALGSMIAPGLGTAAGAALGNAATNLFEMELEGLSPEDKEFEVARQYVKFASEAAKQAAQMPPTVPPRQAAQTAVQAAAKQYAPGLLRTGTGIQAQPNYGTQPQPAYGAPSGQPDWGGQPQGQMSGQRHSGRWIRRGRKIILLGI